MGGNAFTDITVPRLPHDLYNLIRTRCHRILEKYFEDVVTPAEAPSKRDHGDIDFMVARPMASYSESNYPDKLIAKDFGALKFKHTSNSKTSHFAVPIPVEQALEAELDEGDNIFAQVDVHVVPDPAFFSWELLLQSYGDLMQIIGVLNRPLGLTANDRGLFLRIPEIEPKNRKKAMVFLTDSATEMLEFLRLDVAAYEAGFNTNEEVFEWCLQGELFGRPKVYEETANDRNRIRKRSMFTDCMRVYYPEHAERLWPPARRIWTREEVLEEALNTFPMARPTYEAAMAEHRREDFETQVLADMRQVGLHLGADEKRITELVRGSKRFVDYVDGQWTVTGAATRDAVELVPHWMVHIANEEEKTRFMEWLKEHWKEIWERERERMRVGMDMRAAANGGSAWSETTGSVA